MAFLNHLFVQGALFAITGPVAYMADHTVITRSVYMCHYLETSTDLCVHGLVVPFSSEGLVASLCHMDCPLAHLQTSISTRSVPPRQGHPRFHQPFQGQTISKNQHFLFHLIQSYYILFLLFWG